ncbi:uncharacterized protein F4822DRAFT_73175 [Hypoxylon trugodes]|uniref:uncharacterized protein n=1 Tax=Hypoxylon trugodes TaxID=326681 RepID=UPI0021944B5E|nr:uncharacterized protein F4822DRAFT_73175 [Hypoxylon trugodes]KAI1383311.1 hypothetical protein F4822DRAFT_73175 [Hypoxylon trugodes]
MQTVAFITSALALASSAMAQSPASALIAVEVRSGGTPQKNTTVDVPLGTIYNNPTVLDAVSYLYLTGTTDSAKFPLDSITCTPFKNQVGDGEHGLAFNSTSPSPLSTNTVQVGSIVCKSSAA